VARKRKMKRNAMPKRDGSGPPENFHYSVHTVGRAPGELGAGGWKSKRLYGFLRGENGDAPVGHINFHVNPHGTALSVENMETYDHPTNFRGRGVASAMQDALAKSHPTHFIDHGMRTPSGGAWWGKYEDPAPERNIANLHRNIWEEHFDPEVTDPQSYPPPTEDEERQRAERLERHYRSKPAEGQKVTTGFALHLPRDLHARMLDENIPAEQRAHELLGHIQSGEPSGITWGHAAINREGVAAMSGSSLEQKKGEPVLHGVIRGITPSGTSEHDVRSNFKDFNRPMPVKGITWRESDPAKAFYRMPEHTHIFGESEAPIARTSTLLNTQVERLNAGDEVRTPTGQSVKVHKVRPHETDSTLMYLDTDQGTSTVKRGTDFQTVPANNQQQELPGIGNQLNSGNSGQLPMSGRTPAGPGAGTNAEPGATTPCPNCHNLGTLHARGDVYMCSVCGYTIAAGGSPGGLLFSNAPTGHVPPRRKPGEVPRAHVWGSLASLMEEF
jgi:hypothetical protein